MNLLEIVSHLNTLDEDATIYASSPWQVSSEAVVDLEPEEGGLPVDAKLRGLDYFLEVYIAKEFLDGWIGSQKDVPSLKDQCIRLIEYATNDA